MDRFIEVIGEGEFVEVASQFVCEITLEVRAAKDETATKEVSELWRAALGVLTESGIKLDEVVEGGMGTQRPWYWKKQVGQTSSRKIILKVPDYSRLQQALECLEPLNSTLKDRKTIVVQMQQPVFEDKDRVKYSVLALAFNDAKEKATRLAEAMGCRLGAAIQAEEGSWDKRNSGFAGDEDWSGDYSRFTRGGSFMLAAGAMAEPAPELKRPTRTIFVKCRVKFAVETISE
jgi:uncharacterized protein YggE